MEFNETLKRRAIAVALLSLFIFVPVLAGGGGGNGGTLNNVEQHQLEVTPQPTATPMRSLTDTQYIAFDLSPTVPAASEGLIYWNNDENTLNVFPSVPGVSLQVGLENYRLGVNKTANVITDGYAVYISGAQGNRPEFGIASYETYTTAQAIGLATHNISVNGEGYATILGDVRGIDTRAWSAGDNLWLYASGTLTNIKPTSGGCAMFIGTATNSTVNGTISVSPAWQCDRFGNIPAGDYADFEADGTLVYNGDATVWDDLRVPAQSTRINPASSKPDFSTFKNNTLTFMFDAASDETVHFNAQIPHRWKLGTAIDPHVHWTPTSTNTGNVVWGIECTTSEIAGTFGNTSVITVAQAGSGVAYQHQYADFPDIDMSSVDSVSAMFVCNLYRDADATNDTYTGDAALLEIDFHFEIDTDGSREETTK